jgi:hypothetical protein
VVIITASSAAAMKSRTLLETPAEVSMMMMSALERVFSSSIKFCRSSSVRLAILEKPEAPATMEMPY